MNPSELRMMWMSQDAASYFNHPSVGLSIMDDLAHQTTMDINPMMSIVGGDFTGQAAAAAAALGVQPALITANSNDLYGLGLQQQLLQQTAAAAVFQNFHEGLEANGNTEISNKMLATTSGTSTSAEFITTDHINQQSHLYDQIVEDGGYDDDIDSLHQKQEIINIDDFVMMTDSNSYDGTEYMGQDKVDDISQDNDLLTMNSNKLLNDDGVLITSSDGDAVDTNITSRSLSMQGTTSASTSSHRSQRKTRKIEPVNRPGLVLKTPIAYKGNIDPSVIPIQKDGMAVCERCGAIGVKHTFYTKSRRFCSMSCARGELYSLVVNKQHQGVSTMNEQHLDGAIMDANLQQQQNLQEQLLQTDSQQLHLQQQQQTDMDLALRNMKTSSYRFRITDQSKITQINGGYEDSITNDSTNNSEDNTCSDTSGAMDGSTSIGDGPKALRLYHDVLPQDELPQIPKLERLPVPCPQLEKIYSIRRRVFDPSNSYDWTPRLSEEDFFAAPITCFPHAPGCEVWDKIGIQMKVEVENTDCDNLEVIQPGQTPYSFWVATILNICGYKALMRYEGFDDDSHDFWVNLCNAEVHSVGWCATRGKPLIPPRTIENKYKDWKDFLVDRLSGARTLPSSFYNKINDSLQSRFRIGLNLECVNKDRISQVRLATVTKIVGKRLFLRYFDSEDGFWCHEDSPIIHPVGWATTVGHNLAAPSDYLQRMLAGREAMIEVHEDDATIELFKMNFTFEEYYLDGRSVGFVKGMKLEAVDPLNLSSICPATVMSVLKFGYMMIRIDSYQPDTSGADLFCYHEKSPSIFPVGFCAANNITLTPPNGYDANSFTWEAYLQENDSKPARPHLFQREIPNHGFEVGMSLECADLMDPRLVCVATVARVVGRLLKVHFDGWTDEYDQWLDCESPDIYPVGWCVLVNHKLEGPPITQTVQIPKVPAKGKSHKKRRTKKVPQNGAGKVKASNEGIVKTRTIPLKTIPHLPKMSIKLELKPEHHSSTFYENDVGNDMVDEDYDSSNQYQQLAMGITAVLTTPTTTLSIGHANNQINQNTNNNNNNNNSNNNNNNNSHSRCTTSTATVKKSISPAPPTVSRKATSYIGNSSVSNSKYIPRLNDSNDTTVGALTTTGTTLNNQNSEQQQQQQTDLMPDTWNIFDVSQFLRVNDCMAYCDTFSRNKIDGKRLLQLSKDEIVTLLGMKVGPALKIYDLIQQLKCRVNPSKFRLIKSNKSYL